jgi:hypothetical protein
VALTDREIQNAKAGTKRVRLFDERSLYLEVSPGGGKWWRLKYRHSGKDRRLSLGVYPDVSLKAARERRDAARKLLSDGVDPAANKKARAEEGAHTFKVVAIEWFSKFSPGWAEGHALRIGRLLERDIYPWIGSRPIAEVGAPESLAVVRRIEKRGALETAHRALGNCSQVFRYAVATGRCTSDPSLNLRGALPPFKGKHFAAITEPKRLSQILRAMDGYQGTFPIMCALRIAPLVFVRPGELRVALVDPSGLE